MINLDELKEKVQEFVNGLYLRVPVAEGEKCVSDEKYSKRIQHLRAMSRQATVTEEDVKEDERLAYLLSK